MFPVNLYATKTWAYNYACHFENNIKEYNYTEIHNISFSFYAAHVEKQPSNHSSFSQSFYALAWTISSSAIWVACAICEQSVSYLLNWLRSKVQLFLPSLHLHLLPYSVLYLPTCSFKSLASSLMRPLINYRWKHVTYFRTYAFTCTFTLPSKEHTALRSATPQLVAMQAAGHHHICIVLNTVCTLQFSLVWMCTEEM